MITVDIRGLESIQRQLQSLSQDQLPYAMMTAINKTAFKTKNAIQDKMKTVFDRPTPWLIRQVAVKKATKQTLTAIVGTPEGIKDVYGKNAGYSTVSSGVFERILIPHIIGGSRQFKRAESRLHQAGILPSGWYAVPAKDAPLDAYGNMTGSWWMMILSWLNAAQWSSQGAIQNQAEKTSNRKNKLERAGVEMFAAIPGRVRTHHLQPGIYLRQRKQGYHVIKPVLIFVKKVQYKKRLDWYGISTQTIMQELPRDMIEAVKYAIETSQ